MLFTPHNGLILVGRGVSVAGSGPRRPPEQTMQIRSWPRRIRKNLRSVASLPQPQKCSSLCHSLSSLSSAPKHSTKNSKQFYIISVTLPSGRRSESHTFSAAIIIIIIIIIPSPQKMCQQTRRIKEEGETNLACDRRTAPRHDTAHTWS